MPTCSLRRPGSSRCFWNGHHATSQLLGVSASADTLRRLHRLGLPDATLTPAHNAGLMRANVVGARRLAELLPAEGRASLRSYPHGCFCTLQLDFPGAPAAHSDGPVRRDGLHGNCTSKPPRRVFRCSMRQGRLLRSPRFRATMTAWLDKWCNSGVAYRIRRS